jgi:hypothetical protein
MEVVERLGGMECPQEVVEKGQRGKKEHGVASKGWCEAWTTKTCLLESQKGRSRQIWARRDAGRKPENLGRKRRARGKSKD